MFLFIRTICQNKKVIKAFFWPFALGPNDTPELLSSPKIILGTFACVHLASHSYFFGHKVQILVCTELETVIVDFDTRVVSIQIKVDMIGHVNGGWQICQSTVLDCDFILVDAKCVNGFGPDFTGKAILQIQAAQAKLDSVWDYI